MTKKGNFLSQHIPVGSFNKILSDLGGRKLTLPLLYFNFDCSESNFKLLNCLQAEIIFFLMLYHDDFCIFKCHFYCFGLLIESFYNCLFFVKTKTNVTILIFLQKTNTCYE